MTIKELEQAVGMTRANIRFYEQEGLLAPRREENGYRDYSEADARTLERIKLLRRLHLGLEEIRSLQKGETALSDALARQLQKLEADQAALDRAREVCEKLRCAGTDYAALDPKPWLRELERSPAPVSERFAPPADEAQPVPGHPWRRYFARQLDLSLYMLPFLCLELLALRLPPRDMNFFFQLVNFYLAAIVMLIVEPLLLHFWGTTPGKWLLGITLRDADGEKLSLPRAFQRTFGVFNHGLGLGVPVYQLYRQWKCWKTVSENERCPWEWAPFSVRDGSRPERMTVSESSGRWLAWAAAQGALAALAVLLVLQSRLPPCRGELTLAQFCDNWNFYNEYTGLDLRPLTRDGQPQPSSGVELDAFWSDKDRQWTPILEEGRTVGFRYEASFTGQLFFAQYLRSDQGLGLLAYAGSLPRMNCYNFRPQDWVGQLPQKWNYDVTYEGVRLTQQAEFEGDFGPYQDAILLPDGQEATLKLTFTVREA